MTARGILRLGVSSTAIPLRDALRRSASDAIVAEESTVIALACEIAKTVLGREAESSERVFRDVAMRAMAHVRRATVVVLRVHPEDVATAESLALQLRTHETEMLVVEDVSVDRGGVVLDTDVGVVDAKIQSQIDGIAQILASRRTIV
jgi:flagellar biosynthesis/type III secretory pathway protein FliH